MKQYASFDSSFWINAHRSGLLTYVLARCDLHYPPAVAAELREDFPSGRQFWALARQGVLSENAPRAAHIEEFGSGERAAIDLAVEHPNWVLLMDDERPFREATRLGLKVLCTPVLVALFSEGILTARQALLSLARLAALQTLSPKLLAAALAQLGRSLSEKGETDQ